MKEFDFPTEVVDLPSKGLIYPKDHILSSGQVTMKYMSSKEEDILTNENYIDKQIVFDKLLESLTLNKFNIKELHPGDKNSLLVAGRILGYGTKYEFLYKGKEIEVDLNTLSNKPFDETLITENGTSMFTLPHSGIEVEFKFLTELELDEIEKEVKKIQRFTPGVGELSIRLKHTLVSVGGNSDRNYINTFVDKQILARDARELRNYIRKISPDIDLTVVLEDGEEVIIPINLNFFWPDFGIGSQG